MTTDLDVAVIGAGIAGLTAAHELRRAGAEVRVFEASDTVGGRMSSIRYDGYTIDTGAEQISTHGYRATWELLRHLDIPISDVPLIGKDIGTWREGRAHPGVGSPHGLVSGSALSPRARFDLLRFQLGLAARGNSYDGDRPEHTPLGRETLAELGSRYHRDLHDYIFAPLAGAFFGWHSDRSAAAPMLSLMREVGPVTSWRTYRGGMDMLARRLAQGLDVATGREVTEVLELPHGARVTTCEETLTARSVLLCVPAPVAARIRPNPPETERAFLSACTFTPALKVSCLLEDELTPACRRDLYALLTPQIVDDVLAAVIIDHARLADRAPPGRGLVSLIADQAVIPELFEAPDHEVSAALTKQAERYVPGLNSGIRTTLVHRFRHALPEATPQALGLRSAFAARPVGPVDYAGDWLLLRPSSEGAVRTAATAVSRTLHRISPVTHSTARSAGSRQPA